MSTGITLSRRDPDSHSRRDPKKLTYPAARERLFSHLRAIGWTVKPSLKVPQALTPNGSVLYFKAQAVYLNAHSLMLDIRDMSPEEFVRDVQARERGRDPSRGRRPSRGHSLRDPETRRAIARLERQLHETRDLEQAELILRKLLALYSELGDARGVVRCKADIRRAHAIMAKAEMRSKRRGHRARIERPRLRRRGVKSNIPSSLTDVSNSVVWSKDDLALVQLPRGEMLLLQWKSWGPTPIKRFDTHNEAVEYLIKRLGAGFIQSNDPNRKQRV